MPSFRLAMNLISGTVVCFLTYLIIHSDASNRNVVFVDSIPFVLYTADVAWEGREGGKKEGGKERRTEGRREGKKEGGKERMTEGRTEGREEGEKEGKE